MAAFRLGDHTIILAAAENVHSPIRRHIESVGLGPFEVSLIAEGDVRARSLDARLTHGARMRIG